MPDIIRDAASKHKDLASQQMVVGPSRLNADIPLLLRLPP